MADLIWDPFDQDADGVFWDPEIGVDNSPSATAAREKADREAKQARSKEKAAKDAANAKTKAQVQASTAKAASASYTAAAGDTGAATVADYASAAGDTGATDTLKTGLTIAAIGGAAWLAFRALFGR